MRKLICALLCVLMLSPAARAEEPKYVALTFDDGPSGRFTRRLLDGLEERGAKATFFLCGYRLKQYPDLAERMYQQGHELGIHGYSHRDMKPMSRREIAAEIMDTETLLPEDAPVKCFRAPGGCCSDGVRQVARARNYAIVNWSVDPRDWASRDTAAIEGMVLEKVEDGDVVLLHDMSDSSVTAALEIVDRLQGEGFTFVTVSELAEFRGLRLQPGKLYERFPNPENAP